MLLELEGKINGSSRRDCETIRSLNADMRIVLRGDEGRYEGKPVRLIKPITVESYTRHLARIIFIVMSAAVLELEKEYRIFLTEELRQAFDKFGRVLATQRKFLEERALYGGYPSIGFGCILILIVEREPMGCPTLLNSAPFKLEGYDIPADKAPTTTAGTPITTVEGSSITNSCELG